MIARRSQEEIYRAPVLDVIFNSLQLFFFALVFGERRAARSYHLVFLMSDVQFSDCPAGICIAEKETGTDIESHVGGGIIFFSLIINEIYK